MASRDGGYQFQIICRKNPSGECRSCPSCCTCDTYFELLHRQLRLEGMCCCSVLAICPVSGYRKIVSGIIRLHQVRLCHLIFVRNSHESSFFNFTCSRIPASQERLYMKLVTVSQMQAIEKEADAGDLSYNQMMENAGQGLADIVLEIFEGDVESEAVGLVGPGNNGGDTL